TGQVLARHVLQLRPEGVRWPQDQRLLSRIIEKHHTGEGWRGRVNPQGTCADSPLLQAGADEAALGVIPDDTDDAAPDPERGECGKNVADHATRALAALDCDDFLVWAGAM